MMAAYYNEHDPRAAAWLRELIRANLIAPGDVDERSISDVRPDDLNGYAQVHFFAGIGGWSYALRLAGWADNEPVWTGSCPCQPFSVAGARLGTADSRHLWPDFQWLIAQRRPAIIFGEQVASPAGRDWLATVFADLEGLAYRVAGADLCAAGVGAPHIRQRLYWVADTCTKRRDGEHPLLRSESDRGRTGAISETAGSRAVGWVGYANSAGSQGRIERRYGADERAPWSTGVALPCADGKARLIEPGTSPLVDGVPERVGLLRGYGNAIVPQAAATFITAFIEAKRSRELSPA